MVVDHVEDYADARLVQLLHHLLKLFYAHAWLGGVGRVGALWHIIVQRVVAPVVLCHIRLRLVDRSKVERWQNVDGIHAKGLQIVYSLRFGESKELALVLQA